MVNDIKQQVANHFHVPANTLSVSKFFHSSDKPEAKVLFLVADGNKTICIAKVMRDKQFNYKLKRELEGQRFAAEQLNDYLIPKILFTSDLNGHFMVAEEVLTGRPIGRQMATKYISSIYRFQKEQPRQGEVGVKVITSAIKKLEIKDDKLTSLVNELEEMDGSLQRSWSHGDLTFMNVMDIDGKLAIIDWDRYNQRPIWGIDFVHFALRALNVKDRNSFSSKLKDKIELTAEEEEYFARVFLLDEIFDRLHKEFSEKLRQLQF